jgi:peptidoglycan/xylan/chitin deacetylase (PgdA/CDA1 family)
MKKTLYVLLFILFTSSFVYPDNVTFCYHKFSYAMEDIYSTLPEVFEWQLQYIKSQKIPVITPGELAASYDAQKEPGENILLTVDDGWESDVNIMPILDRAQFPVTFYLYPGVIHSGVKDFISPDILEKIKLNKWINYGCHSFTHPVLTKLDDKQLFHEVVDSKAKLEEWIGTTMTSFAYPYGMLNKRVENFCKQYYRAIFGVNDGFNGLKTDRFNLNRFVLYRNTTFGEFIDMCGWIKGAGRIRPFSVRNIGSSDEYGKNILFPKIKYYRFTPSKRSGKGNIILVPSADMGSGWNHKTMDKLLKEGLSCGVIVNRNNNIPFYRPEKDTMKVIQGWGMKEYMNDMVKALDFIALEGKKSVILTWGDGFDLIMAVLSSTEKYNKFIKRIIVINPTFPEVDGTKDVYRKNLDNYNALLAKGEHAAGKTDFFLRIKTLSDMVVIKPDDVSRFTAKMGYKGTMTNKELLAQVLNDEDHPDLGIDYAHAEYTLEDFKQAFMQPVPLLSMVVPIAYLRDLNDLWLNDFESAELGVLEAKSVAVPVSYIYSDSYTDAVKKARSTFTSMRVDSELPLEGISTIEMMLSNNVASFITAETEKMLNSK